MAVIPFHSYSIWSEDRVHKSPTYRFHTHVPSVDPHHDRYCQLNAGEKYPDGYSSECDPALEGESGEKFHTLTC